MSLLENAKNYKSRVVRKADISDEEKEVGLAWLKGEIKSVQARHALNSGKSRGGGMELYRLALICRQLFKDGWIIENEESSYYRNLK